MSGVNKVIFAGAVLLDLTSDTVTEDVIIDGYTGHDAAGNKITGKLKIITVDEALDANSTNPLQNKAIVSALAGKLSTTETAASATKLDSDDGTATKPVYFSGGKPVACTYSLNADVPAGAKFTDTLYTHPDNHPASMITGLSKVATSGSYNDLSNKPTIPTIPSSLPANGGNADTVGGFTVKTNVPANAVFTDTKYTLPEATSNVLGGVKVGSNISVSSGIISLSKTNVTNALGYTPLQTAPVTSVNGMTGDVDITKLFPLWHLDFGDGSDGAFNPSSSVTISGTKNYTSINIPSGVTVTVDKSAYIKCKGDVTINGTVKAVGATGGTPSGTKAGTAGYFAVGGTGGKANSGSPGAGGGALELKSGVTGVTAVINYLNSENIILSTIYSAGGGAGDWEQQKRGTPGSGGTGGGGILIVCKNFTNNGTIDASGSKGGDGGSPYGASGGGGGGGLVYIVCDKNNKTGTINTNGGAGGTGQSYWGTGSNGATGGDGVTYIKVRG